MTRNFYSYAIFFTGIYVLTSCYRNLIYYNLTQRILELNSLANWLIFEVIIFWIFCLILIKYYHHKKYWFTFWIAIFVLAATTFHFTLFYNLLKTVELTSLYFIVILLVLFFGSLHGISLMFSNAGNRIWLRITGLSLFLTNTLLLSAIFWGLISNSLMLNNTIAKIEQWSTLAASFIPLLFIINYQIERKSAEDTHTQHKTVFINALNFLVLITIISSVFFGFKLAKESLWIVSQPNHVNNYIKKLVQPFEARGFLDSQNKQLPYRLLKPLDYDSTKKYPLLVCLHGSSGRGSDNAKQVATSLLVDLMLQNNNRIKYPAFLFVPQCPLDFSWGGMPGLPAIDSLVIAAIHSIENEFSIDKDRLYISGNSMGGYGTWHLICTNPSMFAAAVPISGGGNPKFASGIVDIPIWAFHGAKDRNVSVSGSRDMIKAIKNAGGRPNYTEYPDKAHHIGEGVINTPGLLEWLFSQEK